VRRAAAGDKGGSDDIEHCLSAFERRWAAQPRSDDALVLVSPKRLFPLLPDDVRQQVAATLAPPGQWNAHREAFLRDLPAHVARHFGGDTLREAARTLDEEDARLDFEVARACAEGANEAELRRLLRGHPREHEIWTAYTSAPAPDHVLSAK
jgi:hypothetical protein